MTRSHLLSALIARVEEGSGKDRLLDRDIWVAMGWAYEKRGKDRKPWLYQPANERCYSFRKDHDDVVGWALGKMELTASLDAVLSLIEQKLPGRLWSVRGYENQFRGNVWAGVTICGHPAFAATPARALLAATLKALSALEDSKAGLADANSNGDRP